MKTNLYETKYNENIILLNLAQYLIYKTICIWGTTTKFITTSQTHLVEFVV
jgi:hypothetical protein